MSDRDDKAIAFQSNYWLSMLMIITRFDIDEGDELKKVAMSVSQPSLYRQN